MSKIIDLKEEKRKEKIKKVIMKFTLIFVSIYIIFTIYLILKTPSDTIIIEKGILTEEETAIGIIIRDEIVIKGNNYKNGVYQILKEGEKAAKNQVIFRYYGKAEDELQNKIEEINLKIKQSMEQEKSSIFLVDFKKLEEQIDDKIANLNEKTYIQDISECKKSISDIMLKKAMILGENSQSGTYIKNLDKQKEEYEKELEEGAEYINAPVSGIVSYRVDGLEEVLGVNNLDKLQLKELQDLDIKTGKIIIENNESGKIINNLSCYIVVTLDSEMAKNAEVNDKVKITLPSGKEISATINNINEDDKRIIVLRINELTDELIQYRKLSINITWWSYSGMKVPNSSIIEEENGLKYVIKNTISGKNKVLIKVLKKNENYSIIEKYNVEDLNILGIDSKDYKGINIYDTIMMYP